jgi:hypothetical protein
VKLFPPPFRLVRVLIEVSTFLIRVHGNSLSNQPTSGSRMDEESLQLAGMKVDRKSGG